MKNIFRYVLVSAVSSVLFESKKYFLHTYWCRGSENVLNSKVTTGYQSALQTQINVRLIIWTIPVCVQNTVSQIKSSGLFNYTTASKSTLEVRSTNILSKQVEESSDKYIQSCVHTFYNATVSVDMVGFSDLVRFIALYLYGGIYVVSDSLYLRDLSWFHGQAFAYKWDFNTGYFNTAIMGLPKGSPLVSRIIASAPGGLCTSATFHPIHIITSVGCKLNETCKEFIMYPTLFFDPASSYQGNYIWNRADALYDVNNRQSGDFFFEKDMGLWDVNNFFPGSYVYHWHNRWDMVVNPKSFFAYFQTFYDSGVVTSSAAMERMPFNQSVKALHGQQGEIDVHHHQNDNYNSCKKVFVDLGAFSGDTLSTYGKLFLNKTNYYPATASTSSFSSTTFSKPIVKHAYAFEIDYTNIDLILKRLNGEMSYMKPYTTVIHAAAWNESKLLHFTPSPKQTSKNDAFINPLSAHGSNQSAPANALTVMSYDIGPWFMNVVKPRKCDKIVFKIDVEGAEIEVLESLLRVGALMFIDHLIVEWHDWLMPRVAAARPQTEALMNDQGMVYQYATLDDKIDIKIMPGQPWPQQWCDSHYFHRARSTTGTD